MNRLALLLALGACSAGPTAAELRAPPPARPTPVHEAVAVELPPVPRRCSGFCVDWRMVVEGNELRIDFIVHNRTPDAVRVVDKVAHADETTSVVVRADSSADAIAFTLAWVRFGNGFNSYQADPPPRLVEVEAGSDFAGTVRTPLPLAPWRYYGQVYAILGTRIFGVFEIGYDDHSKAVANPRDLPLLRGESQRLPHGVDLPPPEEQVARNPESVEAGPEPVW